MLLISRRKRSISNCETGILESMDAIEIAGDAKSSADNVFKDSTVALEDERVGIDSREIELRAKIEQHRAGRLEICPNVAPELLKHYERIAKRRTPAVVLVSNELCGGCRVGIPAQVVEILPEARKMAVVEVEGVRREVSIVMVVDEGLKIDDWVLLHVGFAMSIIDEEEAASQLEFMRMLGSVYDEEVEAFSAGVPIAESQPQAP